MPLQSLLSLQIRPGSEPQVVQKASKHRRQQCSAQSDTEHGSRCCNCYVSRACHVHNTRNNLRAYRRFDTMHLETCRPIEIARAQPALLLNIRILLLAMHASEHTSTTLSSSASAPRPLRQATAHRNRRCRMCCATHNNTSAKHIATETGGRTLYNEIGEQEQHTDLDVTRRQLMYSALTGTIVQAGASVLPAMMPSPAEAFQPTLSVPETSRAPIESQCGVAAMRDPALYRQASLCNHKSSLIRLQQSQL